MSQLLYERTGGIAILTLNRPERLNSITAELSACLSGKLTELLADERLRALILTGAGRNFSAGTDIDELHGCNEAEARGISERGQQLCKLIEKFPVPVIGAISGVAAGGGCELVLACHLRIAGTTAMFSLPEVKLGLIPAYGGTQRLRREIGARASELLFTGRPIDARTAEELGLVNRVVAEADVLHESIALAREIEQLAPLAIRACLKAVTLGWDLPLEKGLELEREMFASLFATEDAREGTRAFLEKRRPEFKGR